jgi:hypothetical protein
MSDDALEPVRRIRDAIDRVAMSLDLERLNFAIIPSEDGEPNIVNCVFKINPRLLMTLDELEQLEFDESFKDLVKGYDISENEIVEVEDPKQSKLDQLKKELEEELSNDDWLD